MTAETPVVTPDSPADERSPESSTDTPGGNRAAPETPQAREGRYRTERNEAREQLAAANEHIERLQRAEVERLASASLSHADDVFTLSGNSVADYLDDNGAVDPAKVAADVETILSERPGLRRPALAADRSQGLGATTETQPTWANLLSN